MKALHRNKNRIKSLSIEGISPVLVRSHRSPRKWHLIGFSKNLPEFDRQCRKAQLLKRLTSLTITISIHLLKSEWAKDIPSLVSSSPLEYLQLYGTIMTKDKEAQADDFVTTLASVHGSRLKRLSLHRLPISLSALRNACVGFTNLEQLFIVVEQRDLVSPWAVSLRSALTSFRSSSGTRYRKPPNSRQFTSTSWTCQLER